MFDVAQIEEKIEREFPHGVVLTGAVVAAFVWCDDRFGANAVTQYKDGTYRWRHGALWAICEEFYATAGGQQPEFRFRDLNDAMNYPHQIAAYASTMEGVSEQIFEGHTSPNSFCVAIRQNKADA